MNGTTTETSPTGVFTKTVKGDIFPVEVVATATGTRAVFETLVGEHTLSQMVRRDDSGRIPFEDNLVTSHYRVGDLTALLTSSAVADPEFSHDEDADLVRAWVRTSSSAPGTWQVWQRGELKRLVLEMKSVFDAAGMDGVPMSADLRLPVRAGDAIAVITGEEVAR